MTTVRETLDPSSKLWHLIAVELRRQRELSGISGSKLAELLDCDRSTVSRYESGLLKLTEKHARMLDQAWGLNGLFANLIRFARKRDDEDWFVGLTDYEARASRIKMWELTLVPGLLQTPGYMRAALTAGAGLIDDLDESVARRAARQEVVFGRPRPPMISVILNWVVLQQPIGGDEVMRDQLAHLLELASRPYVSVRVLERPVGAHVGLDGSCKLLTVDDRDIAFFDAPTGGRLMRDPGEVLNIAMRFDQIGDLATASGPSFTLIERAMEAYR
ncbi:helix-turn-helix transcriptional regulator [Actinocorallia longicatena]|uniref:Helix-turn-helix transcriptional regulator n=1 Tax=Actinocorallia longicatena TaxID=111803 RepID=A0ABP6PXZ4_9ACTN